MTRAFAIQAGVGALIGAIGLAMLARPALARRPLGISDGREANYAIRLAGLMLAMLGIMIAAFTLIFAGTSA